MPWLVIAILLLGALRLLARLRCAGWTGLIVGFGVFESAPQDPLAAILAGIAATIVIRLFMRRTRSVG